jgi:hypothetical protein
MQLENIENKGALRSWMLININKKISPFHFVVPQNRRWAKDTFE